MCFTLALLQEATMEMDRRHGLDRFRLDGRVALVTGGSKGLGKAMGEALASAGAAVMLVSRHGDEARAAAAEISSATGQKVEGLAADVTMAAEVGVIVA